MKYNLQINQRVMSNNLQYQGMILVPKINPEHLHEASTDLPRI